MWPGKIQSLVCRQTTANPPKMTSRLPDPGQNARSVSNRPDGVVRRSISRGSNFVSPPAYVRPPCSVTAERKPTTSASSVRASIGSGIGAMGNVDVVHRWDIAHKRWRPRSPLGTHGFSLRSRILCPQGAPPLQGFRLRSTPRWLAGWQVRTRSTPAAWRPGAPTRRTAPRRVARPRSRAGTGSRDPWRRSEVAARAPRR